MCVKDNIQSTCVCSATSALAGLQTQKKKSTQKKKTSNSKKKSTPHVFVLRRLDWQVFKLKNTCTRTKEYVVRVHVFFSFYEGISTCILV